MAVTCVPIPPDFFDLPLRQILLPLIEPLPVNSQIRAISIFFQFRAAEVNTRRACGKHQFQSIAGRRSKPDEVVRAVHLTPCHDISTPVKKMVAKLGQDARVAVLPQGPLSFPHLSFQDTQSLPTPRVIRRPPQRAVGILPTELPETGKEDRASGETPEARWKSPGIGGEDTVAARMPFC